MALINFYRRPYYAKRISVSNGIGIGINQLIIGIGINQGIFKIFEWVFTAA